MAQRNRDDHPGSWHHVMNRGIARRTVFENEQDVRAFLTALACEIRRGDIQVHAYSVMATHFHLLAHSPVGRLSAAMRRALNRYVRRFNRLRRRDGSLFRGRFRSRPIRSIRHRLAGLRYIDYNPVAARLVARAEDYPYGSARAYQLDDRPPWLATWWIDRLLDRGRADFAYSSVVRPPSVALRRFVENRLALPAAADDPLDDLVRAAHPTVASWMLRKAELADQTKPGIQLCDPETVLELVPSAMSVDGDIRLRDDRGYAKDAATLMHAGLLRDVAGLTYSQIVGRLGRTIPFWNRMYQAHARAMKSSSDYRQAVGALAGRAVNSCHRDH